MSDLVGLRIPKIDPRLATRIKQVIESGKPFQLVLHGTDGAILSGDITERFKREKRRQLTGECGLWAGLDEHIAMVNEVHGTEIPYCRDFRKKWEADS